MIQMPIISYPTKNYLANNQLQSTPNTFIPNLQPQQAIIGKQDLTNYYRDQLIECHQKYYPDLTNEEYYMPAEQRNEVLYKNEKLEQLAKYGNSIDCGDIYNKVKDNPNFQELVKSKYLDSANGFVNFINNLKKLQDKRNNWNPYPPKCPGAFISYVPGCDYSRYNMPDYLKMLNDFAKNKKLSDDLKQYYLYTQIGNLDIYYNKLDKLNETNNPLDILLANEI